MVQTKESAIRPCKFKWARLSEKGLLGADLIFQAGSIGAQFDSFLHPLTMLCSLAKSWLSLMGRSSFSHML